MFFELLVDVADVGLGQETSFLRIDGVCCGVQWKCNKPMQEKLSLPLVSTVSRLAKSLKVSGFCARASLPMERRKKTKNAEELIASTARS